MPLDPRRLESALPIVTEQVLTRRDVILYALGVSVALDRETDPHALSFLYEDRLQALPSMAAVLGYPGFWLGEERFGLTASGILHVGHSIEIHRPLPVEGTIRGVTTVDGIIDKGAGKGALVYIRREVYDAAAGDHLATVLQTSLLRHDGGFGGEGGAGRELIRVPERMQDASLHSRTVPEQALIYRLSGDYNPLHILPDVAKQAGFERPILHGLCTYGVVGFALLSHLCARGGSISRLDVRFSAPVYPGERLRTDVWLLGDGKASFRSTAVERNVTVLDNGFAEYD